MKLFLFACVCIILIPETVISQSERTLSIISYNIQMLPRIINKKQKKRISFIPPKMRPYDVVVFSEVFDPGMRNLLVEYMKPEFRFYTHVGGCCNIDCNYTDKWICQDGGVMIFSKYKIEQEDQEAFYESTCGMGLKAVLKNRKKKCIGSDCFSRKGVVYARVNKNGSMYHIFGSHTQASYRCAKDFAGVRARQFDIINSFIERKSIDKNQPVIIAGDLNVDKLSSTLEYNNMLVALNASLPQQTGGPNYTYDPGNNCLADPGPKEEFLDYILFRRDHKIPIEKSVETKIIKRDLPYRRKGRNCYDLSDHYAIVGIFKFD